MHRLLRSILILAVVAAFGAGAASASSTSVRKHVVPRYNGPSLTLTIGAGFGRATNNGEGAFLLANQITQLSGGKIQCNVHYGDLGADLQLAQGVQQGTVDIGFVSTSVLSTIDPAFGVFDLPFVFADYKHVYAVQDGRIGTSLFNGLSHYGIVGLAYSDLGWRNFVSNKKPIRSVSDLHGMKMRSIQSPLALTMWQDLGATPVPLAATDLYPALQNGTIDGLDMPVPYMLTAKLYEVTKYYTLTHHQLQAMAFIANAGRWDVLPKAAQQLVRQAAKIASAKHRDYDRKLENEGLIQLKQHGMQVIELSAKTLAGFVKSVSNVYEQAPNTAHVPSGLVATVRKVGGTA